MKYLLRPLLFMALISLTGCLDENSKDRLDEQQVYTTDKDVYVNAVATLYNYIGGDKTVKDYKVPIGVCTTIIRSQPTRPSSLFVVVTGMTEVLD